MAGGVDSDLSGLGPDLERSWFWHQGQSKLHDQVEKVKADDPGQ